MREEENEDNAEDIEIEAEAGAAIDTDTDAEAEGTTIENTIKKIKTTLKECEKERKEYLQGWQREKADSLNQKKNYLETVKREAANTLAAYVNEILPVLDSVHAAQKQCDSKQADTAGQVDSADSKEESLRAGLDQIHSQCVQSLKNLGVTIVDPIQKAFDPSKHEAIGKKKVENKKDADKVVEVVRVGAETDAVLIRPAMVYIGEI